MHHTGDIMARSTNDLNAVRMMLGAGHHVLGRDESITFLVSVAVMLNTDARLTLMAQAACALCFVGRDFLWTPDSQAF